METAAIIALTGLLVFLAHLFEAVTKIARIPDVLFLVGLGLLLGPGMGLVSTQDLGIVGPVFVNLALVTILFQGGTQLQIRSLLKSFGGAFRLTLINFVLVSVFVSLLTYLISDLGTIRSIMIGVIASGTSSVIVIPLVRTLRMKDESETVLALESAFSDVIVIVTSLALVDAYRLGSLSFFYVTETIIAAFAAAALIGLLAGVLWSLLLYDIHHIKDSAFMTPAFVFVVFGVVEMLGFSGAIAALVFGITIGNMGKVDIPLIKWEKAAERLALSTGEVNFLSEIVFLIKTFFFVYMGISISLGNLNIILIGIAITVMAYIVRLVAVRLAIFKDTPDIDAALMSAMAPKGLAAAVVASIPAQAGIDGGDIIQAVVYSIILSSIVLTSVLIFLIENTSVFHLYRKVFIGYSREINLDSAASAPPKI